jgi:hypothetical protein
VFARIGLRPRLSQPGDSRQGARPDYGVAHEYKSVENLSSNEEHWRRSTFALADDRFQKAFGTWAELLFIAVREIEAQAIGAAPALGMALQ